MITHATLITPSIEISFTMPAWPADVTSVPFNMQQFYQLLQVDWLQQQGLTAWRIRQMLSDSLANPWLLALSLPELQAALQRIGRLSRSLGSEWNIAHKAPGSLLLTERQLQRGFECVRSHVLLSLAMCHSCCRDWVQPACRRNCLRFSFGHMMQTPTY